MSNHSARIIAGAVLMGCGAIAFAIGDFAHGQNWTSGTPGKSLGALASVIGLAMMLVRDRTKID